MRTTVYLHLEADNDRNGNPRRLFYCITTNTDHPGMVMIEAIDEGYEGEEPLKRAYPTAEYAGAVTIPAAEYRRLLSHRKH
jgi:hypothetical protein